MKIKKRYLAGLGLSMIVIAGFMSCMGRGTMQSITVSPAQAIIPKGNSQQFTATAHFSDGTSVDWTSSADWSSANPEIVSVITATGTTGLASALLPSTGPVTITAKDAVNNLSADVTLFITPTQLVDIVITPENQTIPVGGTVQFEAVGIYADGTTTNDYLPTDIHFSKFLTWTSSFPQFATISNTVSSTSNTQVSNGLATGVSGPGTTIITATDPVTHVSSKQGVALSVQ